MSELAGWILLGVCEWWLEWGGEMGIEGEGKSEEKTRMDESSVPDVFPWFGPGLVYEQAVKKI